MRRSAITISRNGAAGVCRAVFFLNLALIGAALLVFLRAEVGLDLNSLLGGATGRRLQTVAQGLVAELRTLPKGTVSASNRTGNGLAVTFTLRRAPDRARAL